MSRRFVGAGASLALVLSGLVMLASTPAAAAPPTDAALAAALDAPAGVQVAFEGDGRGVAVETAEFNDFPTNESASSYVVLSTGVAGDAFGAVGNDGLLSTDLRATSGDPGQDKSSLSLTVTRPAGMKCLGFDYGFGTEEWPTYTQASYNDLFSAFGYDEAGELVNVAHDFEGRPITVNAAFDKYAPASLPGGDGASGINGFMRQLTAQLPLMNIDSPQTLIISIEDLGDNLLDSVVMLDKLRFLPSCEERRGIEGPRPEIFNDKLVGNKLEASIGSWTPQDGAELRHFYRWYYVPQTKCDTVTTADPGDWTPIPSADQPTYTPKVADLGRCLGLKVTGFKNGWLPVSKYSDPTPRIAKGVFASKRPVISGDATVGQDLTAKAGTPGTDLVWDPLPDTFTYQWYAGGSAINGQTNPTLTLPAESAGKIVTVKVTGQRVGYQDRTESSVDYGPVALAAMSDTPTPTLTGDAVFGQQLSVRTAPWLPAPVNLTYQWKRNGVAISGARAATYTLVAADVHQDITAVVTGNRAGYQESTRETSSVEVSPAEFDAPDPTISGAVRVGSTISAEPGTWSPTVSPTYRWLRNDVPIPSATTKTYKLTEADLGQEVHVEVTGAKVGYRTTTLASRKETVSLGQMTPAVPRIVGTAMRGFDLSVSVGSWAPSPTSTAYQWFIDDVAIPNRTGSTYTVRETDLGHDISVSVSGARSAYEGNTATSVPVRIYTLPVEGATPTVFGYPAVGQELRVSAGDWQPAPIGLSYQWLIDGAPLAGATSTTLKVPDIAVDKPVTVQVIGTRKGYTPDVRTSVPVDIQPGVMTPGLAMVSGTPLVGQTLSASVKSWYPTGADMSYVWSVGGATVTDQMTNRFRVPPSAAGKRVTVTITARRAGWTEAYATSEPTAVVAHARMGSRTPTIKGTPKVGKTLKAKASGWSPSNVRLRYQWYVNGRAVSGGAAKKASWKVPRSASGKRVTVRVTGSLTGYVTTSLFSRKTAKVRK